MPREAAGFCSRWSGTRGWKWVCCYEGFLIINSGAVFGQSGAPAHCSQRFTSLPPGLLCSLPLIALQPPHGQDAFWQHSPQRHTQPLVFAANGQHQPPTHPSQNTQEHHMFSFLGGFIVLPLLWSKTQDFILTCWLTKLLIEKGWYEPSMLSPYLGGVFCRFPSKLWSLIKPVLSH